MKVFQTLLDTVRKSCPDVITEEMAVGMLQEFEDGMNQIKADALNDGKAIGYREGYEEGKKVASDQARASLERALEAHDEEYAKKLSQVIDMLNEQHAEKLEKVYDMLKQNYVPRQEMDDALVAQDAEYAEKFETAINKLDEVRTNQLDEAVRVVKESISKKHKKELEELDAEHVKLLEEAVKAVDSKNAKILQETADILKQRHNEKVKIVTEEISSKYKKEIESIKTESAETISGLQKELQDEKDRKLNIIAESIEKYLNYALEERLPTKQLICEQKYRANAKALDRIVDILSVNKIVQESKDNFMAEYESKLNKVKEDQQKTINENIELMSKNNRLQAQLLLESEAQKCTPGEAKFLRTHFKNAASPKIIEESIEEAKQAYKKMQNEHRQHLVTESVKAGAVNTPSTVVTNKAVEKEPVQKKIIAESANVQQTDKVVTETVHGQRELVDIYAEKYANFLRGK